MKCSVPMVYHRRFPWARFVHCCKNPFFLPVKFSNKIRFRKNGITLYTLQLVELLKVLVHLNYWVIHVIKCRKVVGWEHLQL